MKRRDHTESGERRAEPERTEGYPPRLRVVARDRTAANPDARERYDYVVETSPDGESVGLGAAVSAGGVLVGYLASAAHAHAEALGVDLALDRVTLDLSTGPERADGGIQELEELTTVDVTLTLGVGSPIADTDRFERWWRQVHEDVYTAGFAKISAVRLENDPDGGNAWPATAGASGPGAVDRTLGPGSNDVTVDGSNDPQRKPSKAGD